MTSGTPAEQAVPHPPQETAAPGVPTVITVKCAHRPRNISIASGDAVLWKAENPGLHEEVECRLPLKGSSATLTVSAQWPEGTPDTPVTLELEPEGRQADSATRWSFGPSLNDTYSFSWK
ncbi:hypothetical protein V3C20_10045 [Akkermansia sp. RCC_12PD]